MARAKPPAAPPDRVAAYDRLLAAARPAIERKGAANPYTSLNGHMYSFLSASGTLALRLPAEPLGRFLRDYGAALFIGPHGKPMPTFAAVPDELLDDTAALVSWLELSRDHVAGQKPKPTAKGGATKDKQA